VNDVVEQIIFKEATSCCIDQCNLKSGEQQVKGIIALFFNRSIIALSQAPTEAWKYTKVTHLEILNMLYGINGNI
jgi:hypothetical protein